MKFEDLFEHVFVINLDRHQSRYSEAEKELKKVGIHNYQRFPGILVNGGRRVQDRIQGCKLSHLKLIEKAQRENMEQVVIFEDDLEFDSQFLSYLPKLFEFLERTEWEMFHMGANHEFLKRKFTIIDDCFLKIFGAVAAHAYIVHKPAYDFVIDSLLVSPYGEPVDLVYVNKVQVRGKCFALRANPVFQRKGQSFIRKGYRDYTDLRLSI